MPLRSESLPSSGEYIGVNTYSAFAPLVQRGKKYIWCKDFIRFQNLKQLLPEARAFKLRGLKLTDNILSRECVQLLSQELRSNHDLEELFLQSTEINDVDCRALASSLKQNTSLVALDVSLNNVTRVSAFAEVLKTNTTLKYLDIGYSDLENPEAIIELAEALKVNVGLQELRIVLSNGENSGAVALASALEVNNHLVRLFLSENEIGPTGAIALAQSLRTNTTLRGLDLDGNQLKDDVAFAFGQVLGHGGNRTLKYLSLDRNDFLEVGLTELEEAVNVNSVLEELNLFSFNEEVKVAAIRDRIETLLDERREVRERERLDAFAKAQLGDTTTPWLRSKLMVVGRGAAGKTNTVRSLLGLNFTSEWDSTVGIDLTEVATTSGSMWKKTEHKDFASGFVHRLAVEVLEGSQKLKEEVPPQPQAKVIVTLTELIDDETRSRSTASDSLVAEANATLTKKVRKEPTIQYREELFMAQEDTKDAIRMSIWDYGGQTVFYTLHHLFLTQYGVYLIVFNMKKLLSNADEASEYLSFWLNSIQLHAPKAPVLLVGTFLDAITNEKSTLPESRNSKLQLVSEILDTCCSGFNQVCGFDEFVFCPISNKDRSGVKRLRDAIEHETKIADFVQTPVSLKWMRALDILSQSGDRAWMEVAALKVEMKNIGIEREEEIEKMLCLFHELGVVLFFSSSVRLREIVIWKPEWLLEKLSYVIRDKDIHDFDTAKLKEVQLSQDLNCFLQDGIISRDLLEFLWERSQVEYLIELMRHLLLLSNWNFSKEEQFLIPSMLSDSHVPQPMAGCQFYLKFSFLPQGVFERLCCLCVGYSSSLLKTSPPQLYKSTCIVDLGVKGLMQADVERDNKIVVTVAQLTNAHVVLDFILSLMRRIQHDFMHGGLPWQVLVEDGGSFVKHAEAKARKLEPWVRKKGTADSAAIDKFLDM